MNVLTKMKLSFFILLALLIVTSCRKAGNGGDASLMVYPQHHGIEIINHEGYPDTVFLKFNVDELPGTRPSDFDVFFVGKPKENFIRCDGLKAGKYFVYAVGYDSTWLARVKGGMPLKIKYSERKHEINFKLPLTE